MQIAILGRQPALSLAELEALYGAEKIKPIGQTAAFVETEDALPQPRLGGSVKTAKLLTILKNTSLEKAFLYLRDKVPENLAYLPEGKLQLGVSVYGEAAQKDWLLRQLLELKKVVKKQGRSVRIIENKAPELEAATVLYNKLTGPLGWELLLIKAGADFVVARTTGVQNIDDYSKRDFGRPKRDSFVGMLPPKLAQIMINLVNPSKGSTILDPFCGTGVVLQEALLMGYSVIGTDLNPKMIEYSEANLNWLKLNDNLKTTWKVELADATKQRWSDKFDAVVCETYLGQPLTHLPPKPELDKIIDESDKIAEGFLKNIAQQIKPGTRLCLALPAWNLGNSSFRHLKMLDHLGDLGYNRLDFSHASENDLIYFREDQIVARELTILEKK